MELFVRRFEGYCIAEERDIGEVGVHILIPYTHDERMLRHTITFASC